MSAVSEIKSNFLQTSDISFLHSDSNFWMGCGKIKLFERNYSRVVRWFVPAIFFLFVNVLFLFENGHYFETFHIYESIVTIISNANFIATTNYFWQWIAYLSEWHTQKIMKNTLVCCVFCYAGDKRNLIYLKAFTVYCTLYNQSTHWKLSEIFIVSKVKLIILIEDKEAIVY